jgi:hypothetical protein
MTATQTTLTIAQALRNASRIEGRIGTITKRASAHVSWIADQQPEFNFDDLVAQRQTLVDELMSLRAGIAEANATTMIEFEGHQINLILAVRLKSELAGEIKFWQDLKLTYGDRRESTGTNPRTYETEYETVSYEAALHEPERVQRIERLQERIEALNDRLESANHTTSLPN